MVYCLVAATKIIRIKISIQLILDMPFKVRIKEWRTFASWHWETGDEKQCGICRNPFDAICGTGDCNQPGDKCPMISGKCGHKFHYHCIRKWLSQPTSDSQCPLCRASWEYGDPEFYKTVCGKSAITTLPMPNLTAGTAPTTVNGVGNL